VPYSFVTEAGETVKPLEIDDGNGCVAPTVETVQAGEYTPLGRPLFVYPTADALQREEVDGFLQYYIDNATTIAESATFIPLTDDQVTEQQDKLASLIEQGGGQAG
jgi:phosphate transport system substrate-binding protein